MTLSPAPPPPDLTALSDPDLVALGAASQVQQNAQHARLLRVLAEVRDRAARDHQARRAAARQQHFVLTPLEEVTLEFGVLLGLGDHAVEVALHQYDALRGDFPEVWALCEAGRLDVARAAVVVSAASSLARPEDVPEFAALMAAYLARHDDPDAPLVPLTRQQLARAAAYRRMKFEQKPDGRRFAEAFAERRVSVRLDDNGIGWLSCTAGAPEAMLADHRLTLVARKRQEVPGEDRTLDQLRADTLVDLVLGRLTVGALTSELEDDLTADGRDPGETFEELPLVGAWARPVINVTVPVSTLMGLDEGPGVLAGDVVLPAELVRALAAEPGSTWHRLLTDPLGEMVDLSTRGYRPTLPILRTVTARDRTCAWPGCCRPSTRAELDHRVAHPAGPTAASNLDPLCVRHHKAKHADGVTVRRLPDGRYEVRTPRGTVLRSGPSEQPGVAA